MKRSKILPESLKRCKVYPLTCRLSTQLDIYETENLPITRAVTVVIIGAQSKLLKGGYIGDYRGVMKGDTRSLDYSSRSYQVPGNRLNPQMQTPDPYAYWWLVRNRSM